MTKWIVGLFVVLIVITALFACTYRSVRSLEQPRPTPTNLIPRPTPTNEIVEYEIYLPLIQHGKQ